MNAYIFTTEYDVNRWVYGSPYIDIPEPYVPLDLIFAKTPGQARALFIRRHDLPFTDPVRYHTVAKDVNRSRGIAASTDELWQSVAYWLEDGQWHFYEPVEE